MESFSKQNSEYEILTPSGWQDFSGIRTKKANGLYSLSFSSGKHLFCTIDHKIKTLSIFKEARDLVVGEAIANSEYLVNKTFHKGEFDVFDALEVSNGHEYYTNGIVSHNCEFLGSSGTLISGAALKSLVHRIPIIENHEGLKLYISPDKGRRYSITVDVSRGKGLDYSAFHVIDITSMPYQQVCTFKSNMITPLEYSQIIFRTAKSYNDAFILVEVNDIGGQVADSLFYDFEYENIIYTENAGARGKRISTGGASADRGVRTTKTVKSIGCSMLKLLVEQHQLIINDFNTINELSRFSRKGVSYEAEPGAHDDLVMGLVLFAWMSDQQYFKELTDIQTLSHLRDRSEEQLEHELTPFGFMSDGHEYHEDVIDLTKTPYRTGFEYF